MVSSATGSDSRRRQFRGILATLEKHASQLLFQKSTKDTLIHDSQPETPPHSLSMLDDYLLFTRPHINTPANIVRAVENFARNFLSAAPYLAIVAAIFGLISSYQETRGTVKGVAKAQQAWAEWYYQQQEAKAQGVPFDVSPPLFRMY